MDLSCYTSASSRHQCIIKKGGEKHFFRKLIKITILDINYSHDYDQVTIEVKHSGVMKRYRLHINCIRCLTFEYTFSTYNATNLHVQGDNTSLKVHDKTPKCSISTNWP